MKLLNQYDQSTKNTLFDLYCDGDERIRKEKFEFLTKATDVLLVYDSDGLDERGNLIKDRVMKINEYLRSKGLITWVRPDHESRGKNVLDFRNSIEDGIKHTQCVLVIMTKRYLNKITEEDNVPIDTDILKSNIEATEAENNRFKKVRRAIKDRNIAEVSWNLLEICIDDLEATEKWSFTFIGADIDAWRIGRMLNIKMNKSVSIAKRNMKKSMSSLSDAMDMYMSMKSTGGKFDFLMNEKEENEE
jgi:hypothetical protein